MKIDRQAMAHPRRHHLAPRPPQAAVWLLLLLLGAGAEQPGGDPTATTTATATLPGGEGADDDAYVAHAATCREETPFIRRLNALVIATAVVGGGGLVLCTAAVVHIIAHRRHKRSLPVRLVLGMLLSNVVMSSTDMIPTNLIRQSGNFCGLSVIGPRFTAIGAQCLPNAVRFFGAYCTTMYELMMVVLTTHALYTGVGDIPASRERAVHLACLGAGAAALVGYYTRCRQLELGIVVQ